MTVGKIIFIVALILIFVWLTILGGIFVPIFFIIGYGIFKLIALIFKTFRA